MPFSDELYAITAQWGRIISCFCRLGTKSSRRWSNLSEVTQSGNCGAGVQAKICQTLNPAVLSPGLDLCAECVVIKVTLQAESQKHIFLGNRDTFQWKGDFDASFLADIARLRRLACWHCRKGKAQSHWPSSFLPQSSSLRDPEVISHCISSLTASSGISKPYVWLTRGCYNCRKYMSVTLKSVQWKVGFLETSFPICLKQPV